ncbi:MAG: DinB family protein [Bacteroidota bacterium]
MTKSELHTSEYDSFYARYIDKLADETELRKGFEIGKQTVIDFYKSIPSEKLIYRYQPEKWSIKEVFQHTIDTERILIYRCFRIARRDSTALAGFDQNAYVLPSKAHEKSFDGLLEEFSVNRKNSISIINSLTDEDLAFVGNSNDTAMSARAAAFTILGHNVWHMTVIKNRYL